MPPRKFNTPVKVVEKIEDVDFYELMTDIAEKLDRIIEVLERQGSQAPG